MRIGIGVHSILQDCWTWSLNLLNDETKYVITICLSVHRLGLCFENQVFIHQEEFTCICVSKATYIHKPNVIGIIVLDAKN